MKLETLVRNEGSNIAGKTVKELREKYGVCVDKMNGEEVQPETKIHRGSTVLVSGDTSNISRFALDH